MQRSVLSIIAFVLIGISLLGMTLTYVPIFFVEIRYQSRQLFRSMLGVDDLRQIFIPTFTTFDISANSTHRDFGITIPQLGIDEPVIFNVDPNDEKSYAAVLKKGIAHASGTAFPDSPGLGYYFAHSSNPDFRTQYNAVFYLLGKLEKGDEVFIWHEGKHYTYRVTEQKVVDPKDVSFLHQAYDRETIVLQTCWPPGTSSKRLLVWAEREKQ